jgi:AraC-like DNA-binding protein
LNQVIKKSQQLTKLGQYSRVSQSCNYKLSQVRIVDPMLIRVVQGSKVISYKGEIYEILAGELLVVPANSLLDITNQNIQNKIYLADCFTWPQEILKQYESLKTTQSTDFTHQIKIVRSVPNIFNASINYTISIIQDPLSNYDLLLHQFIQLLRCLEIVNINFPISVNEGLKQKLERLILGAPTKKWQSKTIAKHFAMSESTLRRRLSDEGTSLSNILFEARMSYGLKLLQTTHLNITQIAQEVGYDSGSRFAIYFRKRFGFSPKHMRDR